MKKLLIVSFMVLAAVAQAREVESYEASGSSDYDNTDSQICNGLVKKAQKEYLYSTDERISKFGACDCHVIGDNQGETLGNSCRLTYFYETDVPKGDGKPVMKSIIISEGPTAAPPAGHSSGSKSTAKEELAAANYERLRLERDKPDSREALEAAALYNALRGQQARDGSGPKVTKDELASANYERLRLEREKPDSREALEAAALYSALRGQQAREGSGPKVTKDELAMANYERLRLEREKPDSAEANAAERDYQTMRAASEAQDRASAPRTPVKVTGLVLTRVRPHKPSAEQIETTSKAAETGRGRKADSAPASKQSRVCFNDRANGKSGTCADPKPSSPDQGKGVSK